MSTLKDQLIKLGFHPTAEAAEPAWGKGGQRGQGGQGGQGSQRSSRERSDAQRGRSQGGAQRGKQGRGARQGGAHQERFDVPSDPQERALAIKALIKRARQPLPSPGARRFYFQVDQIIDYIEVDQGAFDQLSKGALGVTYDESGRVIALPGVALRELEVLRAAG